MDRGINCFAEQSESFSSPKMEIPEEGTLIAEVLETRNTISDISNQEKTSFSSQKVVEGSSECSLEEIIGPNPVIKSHSNAKLVSFESVMEFTESSTEVKEILESITLQTEETQEMLDVISRAKSKIEPFITQIEDLMRSLQKISKNRTVNSQRGNTYLKSIYQKKLEEFASDLLKKVSKSIKDLEFDYETLKRQEKTMVEIFEKIAEFHRIFYSCTAESNKETVEKLRKTVDLLTAEIGFLKPKQLFDIEKVSYIETDIEMLHNLHHRFLSNEGST